MLGATSPRAARSRTSASRSPPAAERHEHAETAVPTVADAAGQRAHERALEPLELLGDVERAIVAEAPGPQDEVRALEVDAEPAPTRDQAVGHPSAEILEEVLELVALGQSLDQLDLADRDGGLARDRRGEVAGLLAERAIGRRARRQEAEQLTG